MASFYLIIGKLCAIFFSKFLLRSYLSLTIGELNYLRSILCGYSWKEYAMKKEYEKPALNIIILPDVLTASGDFKLGEDNIYEGEQPDRW